jgi:hypothetical protein
MKLIKYEKESEMKKKKEEEEEKENSVCHKKKIVLITIKILIYFNTQAHYERLGLGK